MKRSRHIARRLGVVLALATAHATSVSAQTQLDVLLDTNGDGRTDYIAITPDYDGDPKGDTFLDLQAAMNAMTALPTERKTLDIVSGRFTPPPIESCDEVGEPCYDNIHPDGSSGGGPYALYRGHLNLEPRTTLRCAQGVELAHWPLVEGGNEASYKNGALVSNKNHTGAVPDEGIEVRGHCDLDGGTPEVFDTRNVTFEHRRGIDFTNVSNVLIEGVRTHDHMHAGVFFENFDDVRIQRVLSERDGCYGDQGFCTQAGIYFHSLGFASKRIVADDVTVRNNGGVAFNLRCDDAKLCSIDDVEITRLRVDDSLACVSFRGVRGDVGAQLDDFVCADTASLAISPNTASWTDGDRAENITITNGRFVDPKLWTANAALQVSAYSRNVTITDVEVDCGKTWTAGLGALRTVSPIDGLLVRDVTLRGCGGFGLVLDLVGGQGAPEALQDFDIEVDVRDMGNSLVYAFGGECHGCRLVATGGGIGHGPTIPLTTASVGGFWAQPSSSFSSPFLQLDFDGMPAFFQGDFLKAEVPACLASRPRWSVSLRDAESAADCDPDSGRTGTARALCECDGASYRVLAERTLISNLVQSERGWTDDLVVSMLRNAKDAEGAFEFQGGTTSPHARNRVIAIAANDDPMRLAAGDGVRAGYIGTSLTAAEIQGLDLTVACSDIHPDYPCYDTNGVPGPTHVTTLGPPGLDSAPRQERCAVGDDAYDASSGDRYDCIAPDTWSLRVRTGGPLTGAPTALGDTLARPPTGAITDGEQVSGAGPFEAEAPSDVGAGPTAAPESVPALDAVALAALALAIARSGRRRVRGNR